MQAFKEGSVWKEHAAEILLLQASLQHPLFSASSLPQLEKVMLTALQNPEKQRPLDGKFLINYTSVHT